MKRYFDLYEQRRCRMVEFNQGSILEKAPLESFVAQFKTPAREIDGIEYVTLKNEYEKEPNHQINLFEKRLNYENRD